MFELVSSSKNYLTDSLYHRYYLASYENVCGNKVVLSENYLSLDNGELYCDVLSLLSDRDLFNAVKQRKGKSRLLPYPSCFTQWVRGTLPENGESICISYETFLVDFIEQLNFDVETFLNFKSTEFEMVFRRSTHPALDEKNSKDEYIDSIFFSSAKDLLAYELSYLMSCGKKHLRKCANCGKYFVPSYRIDEIYCKKLYKGFLTCQDYGYQSKIDSSETLKAYRTIYKTQNMRFNRKKKAFPEKSKERSNFIHTTRPLFDAWLEYAKNQLSLCQNGDISLEEMKKRISKSDWLDGVNYADNNETE